MKSLLSQFAIPFSSDLYQRLQCAKYELNNLHSAKTEFVLTYVRQRYWESGERKHVNVFAKSFMAGI